MKANLVIEKSVSAKNGKTYTTPYIVVGSQKVAVKAKWEKDESLLSFIINQCEENK